MILSHDLYTLISCNFLKNIVYTSLKTCPCCLAHARTYVNTPRRADTRPALLFFAAHAAARDVVRVCAAIYILALSSTRLQSVFEEIEFQ